MMYADLFVDDEQDKEEAEGVLSKCCGSFLDFFSTASVETGIFHDGNQGYASRMCAIVNLISLLILGGYCIYLTVRCFRRDRWNVEEEDTKIDLESWDDLLVNDLLTELELVVHIEIPITEYLLDQFFLGNEVAQIYYSCTEEGGVLNDLTYLMYLERQVTALLSMDKCKLADPYACTELVEQLRAFDPNNCEAKLAEYSLEEMVCNAASQPNKQTIESYQHQFFYPLLTELIWYGELQESFEDQWMMVTDRFYTYEISRDSTMYTPVNMEIIDCSISNGHFKSTYQIIDQSHYQYLSYEYDEEGYLKIEGTQTFEEDFNFSDLNLEVGNAFMQFTCALCDHLALEVTKYFVTYKGLDNVKEQMEANIDFTTYKSTITEIVNLETDSLFGILRDEVTIYNIEDPFIFDNDLITATQTMNYVTSTNEPHFVNYRRNRIYQLELGSTKLRIKAWPRTLYELFGDWGGWASFLGIVAIGIAYWNNKAFMKSLRDSVTPNKAQEGYCDSCRSALCPSKSDQEKEEEIQKMVSYKQLFFATKVVDVLRKKSPQFKKMVIDCQP